MSSPSASVAVTVPIAVWFSSAVKVALEVKVGLLSFRLLIFTVIFWFTEFPPSLTETVAVYDDLVS